MGLFWAPGLVAQQRKRMIKEIIIHIVGPVDGPKGNLSVIPDALSRSKRGAVTRRAVAQRRSRVAA